LTNVKSFLEGEQWTRLPLPDNYEIKELANPLVEFPKNREAMLNLFLGQEESSEKKKSLFSQFAHQNPFEKNQFIVNYRERRNIGDEEESPSKLQRSPFSDEAKEEEKKEEESEEDDDIDDMDIGDDEELKV